MAISQLKTGHTLPSIVCSNVKAITRLQELYFAVQLCLVLMGGM
jgi:hypothetical protein